MGRLTRHDYNEDACDICESWVLCKGKDCLLCDIYEKLAHYEDMEEQGRLIELPCAVGDTVWTYWIDDEESGVMADVPMSEQECLIIRGLWGKDYFATREEAVRKLDELKGE